MINIQLDFTIIECDLKHANAYTNRKCEICQEDFSQFYPHIDPKVEKRKEILSIVFDTINEKQTERKVWFKKYRKNEVSKLFSEEPFDMIQPLISKLNDELNKTILDTIDLTSESISKPETLKVVESFALYMGVLFDIVFEAERLELSSIWKNMNCRLISSINHFIAGYLDLLSASIALNYQDALTLRNEGQKRIDFANNEITILTNIIHNQNTMISVDLFAGGKINQSALISMVFGNKGETFNETINNSNKLTYYYFSSLIEDEIEEINISQLTNLSHYTYLGTCLFDDISYFRKISIVISVIERAMSINPDRFRIFFKAYTEKLLFIQAKLYDFSTDFAFILGNSPSEDMLMRTCIKWYKDLSEGIYKDTARLIYYCMNIINQKEFKNEDVLVWLGFGDIVSDFEQQKKLKLNYLTEGVEKIIRHSEAHVDYVVKDGVIKLRNVIPREREINHMQFTFEEFFDITNKLAETIFAIMCGINLHLINNAVDFADEIVLIDEALQKSNDMTMTQIIFAVNGVSIEKQNITYTNKSTLSIEGKLMSNVEFNKLSNVLFNSCAFSYLYDAQVDEICFSLNDIDGNFLGKTVVPTKYLKRFQDDNGHFKEYNLLLLKLSSEVDEIFSEDLTSDRDLICLKSVFVYLHNIIRSVNLAFRDSDMNNNERIKNELKSTNLELESLKEFVILYKELVLDEAMYLHINMLVSQVGNSIKHMISGGIVTPEIDQDFNNLKAITDLIPAFQKLIMNEITRIDYLYDYLKKNPLFLTSIGVNSPCPCGSGKKFKKCCKLKLL